MKKLLLFIILLAFFVRIYKLPEFTEFFGDQGMDAILIHNAIENKSIPLVGPLSSQGLHQGATYLYLVAPSLLFARFDPLGPAFFMAALGTIHVLLFYFLSQKLFGKMPAQLTTLILAVSPIAITQSRTYWNSFLMPLATTLLLVCFVTLKEKKSLPWFLMTGFALGFTAQFHYTGLTLLILSGLLWITLGLWRYRKFSLAALLAFLVPLLPFFLYQLQHNFVDIKGLLLYLLPFREVYRNIATPNLPTLFSLVFQNLTPSLPLLFGGVVGIFVVTIPFFLRKRASWHMFFTFWIILGVFLVSRNKGDFQIHYMDFLFPIPFLLFASFLAVFEKKKIVIFSLMFFFLIVNMISLDIFRQSPNILGRTKAMVSDMSSEPEPFSFTIISPSFSDSHYRYLFKIAKVSPQPIIEEDMYDVLYIACERQECPTGKRIEKEKAFQVTCFDLHCAIEYPKIDLTKWKLKSEKEIVGGKLFRFERKTPQDVEEESQEERASS